MKDQKSKKMVIAMITKNGIAKTWIDPDWQKEQERRSERRGGGVHTLRLVYLDARERGV